MLYTFLFELLNTAELKYLPRFHSKKLCCVEISGRFLGTGPPISVEKQHLYALRLSVTELFFFAAALVKNPSRALTFDINSSVSTLLHMYYLSATLTSSSSPKK